MFRNTLTANDKYPYRHGENLSTQIKMHLSLKQKTSSHFFNPFLHCTSNLKRFEKKMIVVATLFRKLQTVKDLVRLLSKKQYFGTLFHNQLVKGSQTLVKSA